MNNPAKVMTALSHAGYEFLISDVELAFTFTRIASRAVGDRDKRIRNLQNARRAYQKVQELVPRVGLTAEQQQHVTQKLVALKSALEKVSQPV
jgi:hypothetical protein